MIKTLSWPYSLDGILIWVFKKVLTTIDHNSRSPSLTLPGWLTVWDVGYTTLDKLDSQANGVTSQEYNAIDEF